MEEDILPPQHCSTTVQVFLEDFNALTKRLNDADVIADIVLSFAESNIPEPSTQ